MYYSYIVILSNIKIDSRREFRRLDNFDRLDNSGIMIIFSIV